MPSYERFLLPDAGEGLTEADIVQWRVAVGDTVQLNQEIVEIETAKSLVELPSPYAGVVSEIVVPEGKTANVGDPIVIIDVDPDGDPAAPDAVRPDATAPAPDQGTATNSAAGAAEESSGSVLVGYGLSDAGGTRRRRRGEQAPAATPAADSAGASPAASRPEGLVDQVVRAKPPVRKLARDLGIDLVSIAPSGPGGIVTREDVLEHHAQAQARDLTTYIGDDSPWLADGKVSPDGRQTRVPVRSVRKRTAEAMVASAFTAPHITVFQTVDVTKTMRLVARLKESREFSGVRVTPLLVAMKSLLLAVDRHPEVNASWDDEAKEIVYKHYVNLGIAAATPRGLVVPNIKDAHRLSLRQLAEELAGLTTTARAGKTTPRAMSDGTITITNVGVFGIDTGTPILNPGEAAILAFGTIRQQPWVHKGAIKKRWITQLALSVDHRLVDGELAARVVAAIAAVLEEPANGLVWG